MNLLKSFPLIPGTGERGGLPSMGSHRVGHDWNDLEAAAAAAAAGRGVMVFLFPSYMLLIMFRLVDVFLNLYWALLLLLLLLLLSRFSRVRLCATPEMAAHQAPPSLGFSRQEHWSGSIERYLKKKKSIVLCGCVLGLWRITVLFRRPQMTLMCSFYSQHLRSHQSPVTCPFRIFHTNQIMLVLPISLEVEPLGFHANCLGT